MIFRVRLVSVGQRVLTVSKGPDLVSVMSLAHKYQVDKAIRHCSQKLSNVMTIEHACSYLAQEATMREEGEIPPGSYW